MRPVVIIVFDSEAGTTTEHTFHTSPVRIGRNPLNDLPLAFPFVSGWHAVVRFDDGQAKFFDLGSTNGTLLNGRKVQAGEPVVIGELLSVTIGKLELRFRRDTVASGAYAAVNPAGYPAQGHGAPPVEYPATPTPSTTNPTGPGPVAGTIDRDAYGSTPSPLGQSNTAHVQMADVHHAIQRLRPRYEAYRQAWAALFAELQPAITSMHPTLHEFAIAMLGREFPTLRGETEFSSLAQQVGARLPDDNTSGGGGDGAGMAEIQRFSQGVRPSEEPPRSAAEADRFLACVADVLKASAKAFVELQKGQEQFGNEMGVRTIKEFTPLHAAGTPDNVLKYLLDWQKGGPHRTQELVGVYADLMIHQVALINGVMEGVRSLLAQLEPNEIERGVTSAWPTRSAAAWKAFVQRYRQMTEADRNITEHVFGPEFARAYAEVGGEGSRG